MTKRTRVLLIGAVAALAVAAVAFVVLGQEGTTADSGRDRVIAKLAANLGVSVDDLVAAFKKTRLDLIDEAVAAGKITAEQAQAMKDRMEAREALRDVMEEAIASGKITREQLELFLGRGVGRGMPGRGAPLARGRGFLRERLRGWMAERKCACPQKSAP